jgi:hypothetical protein
MAQTKKKRSTKHRGNAAGVVETRGRTGRKLTDAERKANEKQSRGALRADRFSRPPTWRSAANRSLIAVFIFVAILVLFLGQEPGASFALGGALLILYIPMSYYTDLWLYRRRMRKEAEAKAAPRSGGE